ncbi:MAG TPA: hypothetical protein VIL88_14070 [Devosia sp.]|jgi:hypothetical protein|uniref:hypothetical protein n=1 Tax=Devosia sp. TaxID=1871048 RepID=UPI002F93F9EC
MRTNLDLITHPFDQDEITRADFVGYYHPREIVADPQLTVARKRALLSRWMSDANALPNAPAIRRSPAGVTTSVDDLRQALNKLDEMVEAIAMAELGRHSGSMAA